MKREKMLSSPKRLKSFKHFTFVKREVGKESGTLYDHFQHNESGFVFIRVLTTYELTNGPRSYVHWTCPELGGGTGNLWMWIQYAKRHHRHQHDN